MKIMVAFQVLENYYTFLSLDLFVNVADYVVFS